MPAVGILGAEAYAASFVTEIAFQSHYSFVGIASQNVPLPLQSKKIERVDPEELILKSDILIADGSDLRFQQYMLLALRYEKTLFVLNPLSLSISFFDELSKTAVEAGAKLIPPLPFWLEEGNLISELRQANLLFLDYQQQIPEQLSINSIRNSLFLLYYLSGRPILSVYHYIPIVQEYKSSFIHFSLKFENGSGAALSLSAMPNSSAAKGNLSIHNGEIVFDTDVSLAPYSQTNLKMLNELMQGNTNEQLNCAVAWYLNWFEKKILSLL